MCSPCVLLIGGPPGAGKTTLGRALSVELNCSALTADDIRYAVRAMTTPDEFPAIHQSIGHLQYFTEGPTEKLISDAIALQEELWPAIENIVRFHASVKTPIIIDWWLLSPPKIANLGLDNVASVWIHIDPDVLEDRERNNSYEFYSESHNPDQILSNFMQRSWWRNKLVSKQAKDLGLDILEQPGNRSVADLTQEAIKVVGWRRKESEQ